MRKLLLLFYRIAATDLLKKKKKGTFQPMWQKKGVSHIRKIFFFHCAGTFSPVSC